jgi:hypothetical protein
MSNSEQSFDHSTADKSRLEDVRAASRSQHTPGPWRMVRGSGACRVDGGGGTVAWDVSWAPDAALIATAPELLAALKSLAEAVDEVDPDHAYMPWEYAEAMNAIAKAEGK